MWSFNVAEPVGQKTPSVRSTPRRWRPVGLVLVLSVLSALVWALQGFGGAAGTGPTLVPAPQSSQPIPNPPVADAQFASKDIAASLASAAPGNSMQALAAVTDLVPDPGLLLMLVPDGQDLTDPRISAWQDAASEEGVRLQPITDAQFLSLGAAATAYAGLILPDSLHTQASDALIAAIRTYTQNQGRTMLVYDFGALLPSGFYPVTGPSRLSDLAGVQYIRYAELGDQTTGLGPVRALRQTMRALLVPPGKSTPYVVPTATPAMATSTTDAVNPVAVGSSLLDAARLTSGTALYLPVDTRDPGGAKGYDPQQFMALGYREAELNPQGQAKQRSVTVNFGKAFKSTKIANVSQINLDGKNVVNTFSVALADTVDAYSGYLLGNLVYPVYATAGEFGAATNPSQLALADSPQFGLVAGVNPVGTGRVLFVNLPLTYLKGRTDGLPMHGFLHYFVRNVLNLPHLSSMPNGVAGMTFDWHLDSKAAQAPTLSLMKRNVFKEPGAYFSIGMTAGPDTLTLGDKLGWDLAANLSAQRIMTTFDKFGHSVGSHGGWIHDFYGNNAAETNQTASTAGACVKTLGALDNFQQCLVLNRQDVNAFIRRPSRVYSAPQGNNPPWAMSWLESQGVVAAYFGGHTGLGVTRQYRDGVLANPGLWVSPVTPQGFYATYEEFQDFNVPKADVTQWYRDLMDFNIAQNTSRMVYAHPPGADLWYDVLSGMFTYAKTQRDAGKLAWYTMTRLADFMTTRLRVTWTQTVNASTGATLFNASHPVSLNEFVWRLPKARYPTAPVIVSGVASVGLTEPDYWLVKAQGGTSLSFMAKP